MKKHNIFENCSLQCEKDKLKYLIENYKSSFFLILNNRNKECKDIYEFIIKNTQFLPENANISVRSYFILNDLKEFPRCKNCGKELKLKNFRGIYIGFSQYCNNKCSNSSEIKKQQLKNIFINKIGTTCPLNNKELREKGKKTKLEKYGNENYTNIEKAKQTCLKHFGVEYPFESEIVKEKFKKTMLERYGVEYSMQSKVLQEKHNKTVLEIYGKDNFNNRKKAAETYKNNSLDKKLDIKNRTIQTNIKKYGYENPMQSEIIKNKIRNTKIQHFGTVSYNNRDKAKQTCLEKYGVSSWTKTEMFRQQLRNVNEERMQKQFITKKKNNSFSYSKQELVIYQLLKEKFNDVIRQYKSEKYPFKCDFYIPCLDLYIEYNGIWTHGKHAFNKFDENDQKTLQQLIKKSEIKNSKYYKTAIQCWTVIDPLKRETAKNNNLNYVELWNLNDAKKFIETLKNS